MVTAVSPWAGVDHAQTDAGSMTIHQLNSFLQGMDEQPPWRISADIESDYYDGNQYTAQDLAMMEERGIPPIVVNLTAPAINMVLGLEAKTRTDFMVRSEHPNGQHVEMAQAMSIKMKEAERLTGADQATSDAHASQIKAGLGWIHLGYNWLNPFGYPILAEHVHRREIWWDWHDMDPWLRKARYLVRRKWYDEDVLIGIFPQYKDLIYNCVRDWAHFDPGMYETAVPMYMDQTVEREWAWRDEEWKDSWRRRLCLYETWYRTYRRGFVLRTKDERVIEYKKGGVHDEAIARGMVAVEPALIPKVRLSWWLGPHRISDMPSPYPHQYFPYIPFWGYREDRTGVPYGMIRAMRPLQDEVNARRARMLWQLSARRVITDDDAVLDHKAAQEEVARADMYLKLNPNRRNKRPDAFRIDKDENLSAQQFSVYEDSKRTLQDAAGIYLEQLGKKGGGAESGIAISQLIETGTTTLAEINDNYRTARMLLGEQMLALVRARMAGKQEKILIESKGQKKAVHLNRPRFHAETQETTLENDVTQLMCSVALDEVPQTPTARTQMYEQMVKMLQGLPENMQAAVIDIVVKASDYPYKDEMVERLRSLLGIQNSDPDDMTPEEQQAYEKMMADQEEIKELTKRLQAAEVALKEAQATKAEADAELSEVKADEIRVNANLNPELRRDRGTPDRPGGVPDTRAMRIIEAAEQASQQDVPGADPVKLERSRMAQETA